MPSLTELMKQKLKEQKESKREPDIKITPGEKKEIKPQDLKPPKPPKTETKILPQEIQENDEFFIELAQTTEFKRFIYRALYGKVHRTVKKHGNLEEKVKTGLQILRNPKFSGVIKEMKTNFENGVLKPSQIIK